jgi:UDP-glucose 4-epimerase
MGEDYPTPDGTAVRDYIHVLDLADAHVAALRHLLAGGGSDVFNLGTGTGTSVKELIAAIQRASNGAFDVERAPRREGDSPILVADNSKARAVLGWRPQFGLDAIIESAWSWHRAEAEKAQAIEPGA